MVEHTEFAGLVRDALARIHDYAALETHELGAILPKPPHHSASQADWLRSLLVASIERLRPDNALGPSQTPEWRPYAILQGRYLEGLSWQALQDQLSLSARQMTREHTRAVAAIVSLLRTQITAPAERAAIQVTESVSTDALRDIDAFDMTHEELDLGEIAHAVVASWQGRDTYMRPLFHFSSSEPLSPICGDRVVLRQILFSVLGFFQRLQPVGEVAIAVHGHDDRVDLSAQTAVDAPTLAKPEVDSSLDVARSWCQRCGATLTVDETARDLGFLRLVLSWPVAEPRVVMVVDDQEPAIRLFQRYLSHSRLRVVGVREPEQVVSMARSLQPAVITLDVMMPTMDGWEVLQSLLSDPETRHIPVVICSVWDEPQLALSFGADGFLKKPISQRDLLHALRCLGLLGSPDEEPAAECS